MWSFHCVHASNGRSTIMSRPSVKWINLILSWIDDLSQPSCGRFFKRHPTCFVMLCHVVRSVVSLSTTFAMIESHHLSLIQDAMMRHLNRKQDGFSHLVVADTAFDVFTGAQLGGEQESWCNCQKNSCSGKVCCRLRWCIAEIVESGRSRIRQQIKLLEGDSCFCLGRC